MPRLPTGNATTTILSRDALQRVENEQRAGITTSYVYDAAGRQTRVTRSGQGLSLSRSQSYDLAGRLEDSTDESGLLTAYDYAAGGRVTTVTRPGGFTEVTEHYLDGQQKSVTGTAVVAQRSTHGVHADGSRWSETCTGPAGSPMCARTTVDVAGRTIRVERPGFGGGVEASETFYNDKGQVERTTASGRAETRYEYDALGNQIRSGLDVDGSGELELASADRIRESESYFVSLSNSWWQQSQERVYPEQGDGSPVTARTQRTRLSGHAAC